MIPIRIKQFPRFIRQSYERSVVLNRKASADTTFHLCFFSCHSYFRYLYCSLHSIVEHMQGISFRVIVFSDEEQPLSSAQIETIKVLIPNVQVIPWPKSMGWGEEQIGWIWKAYELAADGVPDSDYIVRIDSDVFFFNDRIFRAVANSNADFIGDGHFVDFEYCQGGCYFFRVSAVNIIVKMLHQVTLQKALVGISIVVEDVAAYYFSKALNLEIWQTWFMMFPDELRNAGALTGWQRWKFSCVHFVMKNKVEMLTAYQCEILKGNPPESYILALDVV